eukprot:scaffold2992_cov214-Amphora_coffeaeformis.AAC.50
MGVSSQTWFKLILSGTAQEAELIHNTASTLFYYVSPILFVLLNYMLPSPYGKLTTSRWGSILGPVVPARLAWFLFEVPNLLWVVATVWKHYLGSQQEQSSSTTLTTMTGGEDSSLVGNYILLGFFTLHYLRRTIWYPWRMMSLQAKPVPLGIILSAMSYTSVNGYLQCQSLLAFHRFPLPSYGSTTAYHLVTFGGGLVMALAGMIINAQTDAALCRLRSLGKGYQIPRGYWLFDYVSCPHYLGEILEWLGFFVACPTLVTASFVAFTASNLIPRAVQQHAWYQNKFGESYPAHRKAWLPLVW